MADPLRLAALAESAIAAASARLGADGNVGAWEREMERILARAHTASWLAGASERLGVPVDSPLLSQARLSKAERADIARAVKGELDYLKGFAADIRAGKLSPAAAAARAKLYAGATRKTYYGSRWGGWDIPSELMPGNQACLGNCRCTISVRDNGDGTGVLTRTMHAEHHCTQCPALAGDHPVRRGTVKEHTSMANQGAIAREADRLEIALKEADLRQSQEVHVWDVWEQRGLPAALGAIAGIKGAEKLRLKQASAPGMTTIEVPMELADVLNAARSEEGDSKIIAILRQIAGRSAPTSGGTLGDDQKPVATTKARSNPIEDALAYEAQTGDFRW